MIRNGIKPGKAIGGNSVAEHSSLHPEVEGSSPAVTADTINGRENDKNVFKGKKCIQIILPASSNFPMNGVCVSSGKIPVINEIRTC